MRTRPQKRRLNLELLEPRLVLSGQGLGPPDALLPVDPPNFDTPPVDLSGTGGGVSHQVAGTNWIDPNLPLGHNAHTDHVTWDTNPSTDAEVIVDVLIHDHGNLSPNKLARLNDAIAEVNSAAANFGVLLNLDDNTTLGENQIHLHEDSTSACGSGALGCAAFALQRLWRS